MELEKIGFEKKGTGTWEATAVSSFEVTKAINAVLNNLKAEPEILDHLWIYVDRVEG